MPSNHGVCMYICMYYMYNACIDNKKLSDTWSVYAECRVSTGFRGAAWPLIFVEQSATPPPPPMSGMGTLCRICFANHNAASLPARFAERYRRDRATLTFGHVGWCSCSWLCCQHPCQRAGLGTSRACLGMFVQMPFMPFKLFPSNGPWRATLRRSHWKVVWCWMTNRGTGTNLKLGGGQTSPGVKGNPYPKLKTLRIWPTIFWETPKFTYKNKQKIKMNNVDSPKWGGGGRRPHSFQVVGESCPHRPSGSRVPDDKGPLAENQITDGR